MTLAFIPRPSSEHGAPLTASPLTISPLTMKLWVLSDLHLDVNRRRPLQLPDPRPAHDAVVIAGDLCQGIGEGLRFIAGEGLNAKAVLYVAGNHEFYGRDRHAELRDGRNAAAAVGNVHLLERDSVTLGGIEFLGCTLWTDYLYAGIGEQARALQWAGQRLNDHRLIANGPGLWLRLPGRRQSAGLRRDRRGSGLRSGPRGHGPPQGPRTAAPMTGALQ
jgi:hypothetical protein